MNAKPVPRVGSLIRKHYGSPNPNNWKCWGEVRAVVDDHIVCRLWVPGRNQYVWLLIDPETWQYGSYEIGKP